MAWIKTVDEDAADGLLARVYEAARSRAGRVFNIVKIQSLNPAVAQSSMMHYMNLMHQPSPLSRAQREMIATVVSRVNNCHY
jgi:uncharacterized peroxidase-related enzyme